MSNRDIVASIALSTSHWHLVQLVNAIRRNVDPLALDDQTREMLIDIENHIVFITPYIKNGD